MANTYLRLCVTWSESSKIGFSFGLSSLMIKTRDFELCNPRNMRVAREAYPCIGRIRCRQALFLRLLMRLSKFTNCILSIFSFHGVVTYPQMGWHSEGNNFFEYLENNWNDGMNSGEDTYLAICFVFGRFAFYRAKMFLKVHYLFFTVWNSDPVVKKWQASTKIGDVTIRFRCII